MTLQYDPENPAELVVLFRDAIMDEVKKKPGSYSDVDLNWFFQDNVTSIKFIRRFRYLDRAVKMAHTFLTWRQDYKINDLRIESLNQGIASLDMFPFIGKDKEGNFGSLYLAKKIRLKDWKRQDLERYMIYLCEERRIQLGTNTASLIICATDCGLENVDMALLMFLMRLTRDYYGFNGGYLIIYEFPWFLRGLWNVTKTFLNEEDVMRVKFLDKKSIKDLYDEKILPSILGGTSTESGCD